jgi:hypothetical protein
MMSYATFIVPALSLGYSAPTLRPIRQSENSERNRLKTKKRNRRNRKTKR